MPPNRQSRSRSHKERTVPIRVVKSQRRTAPPAPEPMHVGKKQSAKPQDDRRMLMWTGVVAVSIGIFILWIFSLRSNFSRPVPSDTFLGKIKNELSTLFSKLRPFPSTLRNIDNTNSELDELRSKVFPDIGDKKFQTGSVNE